MYKSKKLYRVLLNWFVVVGILFVATGLALYSYLNYHSVKGFMTKYLVNISEHQIAEIDNWFEERSKDIYVLSLLPCLKDKDIVETKRIFKKYQEHFESDFDFLTFVDSDGKVLVHSIFELQDVYVRDRQYYRDAIKGKATTCQIILDKTRNIPTIIVANPVYNDSNEIIGVIVGGLSLNRINEIIVPYHFGNTGETYLVNDQGLMLTESRFTPELIREGLVKENTKYNVHVDSIGVSKVIKGQDGMDEYLNYRGKKVIGLYRWLPQYNWGLVSEIEKMEFMADWFNVLVLIIFVFMSIVPLVIYPSASYIAGRIVNPINELAKKVALFSYNYKENDISLSVLDYHVYEEINVLSQVFNRMSEKLRHLMDNLELQALYDPLTCVANRRYFLKRGQQIIQLAKRSEGECSLIFLDVDKFKHINDSYGHNVGDQVLAHMAKIIVANIRANDVVGRLGGEEFAVMLPNTELAEAQILAERLRKYVAERPLDIDGKKYHITISIGIASYKSNGIRVDDMEIIDSLLRKADAAMYKAKKSGRNKVEIYRNNDDKK